MIVRELINKLAQYDLAAEVIATSAGVLEVPKIYESPQGWIVIDLDCRYKNQILSGQIDIDQIMKEE